jgi:hypothetical protein
MKRHWNQPLCKGYNAKGCKNACREPTMSQAVTVELELPQDLQQFRLPVAVEKRLQQLLDSQDRGVMLSEDERAEAEGLVDLAEALSLLKLRAERARRERTS